MNTANPNTTATDITCDRDAASESINNTNPPNNSRHTIAVHGYPTMRTVVISPPDTNIGCNRNHVTATMIHNTIMQPPTAFNKNANNPGGFQYCNPTDTNAKNMLNSTEFVGTLCLFVFANTCGASWRFANEYTSRYVP